MPLTKKTAEKTLPSALPLQAKRHRAGAKLHDIKNIKVPKAIVEKQPEPEHDGSAMTLYLNDIGQYTLITAEEEVRLAKLIQEGDEAAKEKLIRANLRLVVKIAKDYAAFGLPLLDLIAEGNVGLMQAVKRFDPKKGGKMSTYAAWWIKQYIKRALSNHGKMIRLPIHLVERLSKIRKVQAALEAEFKRPPTDEEVAAEMGLPTRKVAHLKMMAIRPTSLQEQVGPDSDENWEQHIADEKAIDPAKMLVDKTMKEELDYLLSQLDERQVEVLKMRFGLKGGHVHSLEEVGDKLNLTRERIRQLQESALLKLRDLLYQQETTYTKEELKARQQAEVRLQLLHEFAQEQQRKKQQINC